MSYISQSEKTIPWNHVSTVRNRTNVWILINGRKYSTIVQQFWKPSQVRNVQEYATVYISSQTAEIRTLPEPIIKKIDAHAIK